MDASSASGWVDRRAQRTLGAALGFALAICLPSVHGYTESPPTNQIAAASLEQSSSDAVTAENPASEPFQYALCATLHTLSHWEAAGDCFTKSFFLNHPGSPRLDRAIFAAADSYDRAALYGKAVACWDGVVALDPESPLAGSALLRNASTHRSSARFDESARYDELFATNYPGEPGAASAWLRAAEQRHALDDLPKAISDLQILVAAHPDSAEAGFARLLLDQWLAD